MKKQEQNITKTELVILAKKMALSLYLDESKFIVRSTFKILNKSNRVTHLSRKNYVSSSDWACTYTSFDKPVEY